MGFMMYERPEGKKVSGNETKHSRFYCTFGKMERINGREDEKFDYCPILESLKLKWGLNDIQAQEIEYQYNIKVTLIYSNLCF